MALKKEPRITLSGIKMLQAFLNSKGYRACGADIMRATGLLPGTTYPLLSRFKEAGWLTSEWEQLDPSEAGRPPRLYYQLTGQGQKAAIANLSSLSFSLLGAET